MNNLSLDDIKDQIRILEETAVTGESDAFALRALRELLALREAGKEPVGFRWRYPASRDYDQAWAYVNHRATPDAFESEQVIQYLYAAPQLPAVPEYPELLPCPVLLEPGLRLSKGVKTSSLLMALAGRAEHDALLEAMTPGERAEYDATLAEVRAALNGAIAAAPKPEVK
ncbi:MULTISPECIES: hypothetical protein [unclassified Cedecea]|uniref:hypothetical protein n=1 Tax=unclassified Cedecea TaxID=2649846 RepID=UPI0030193E36